MKRGQKKLLIGALVVLVVLEVIGAIRAEPPLYRAWPGLAAKG